MRARLTDIRHLYGLISAVLLVQVLGPAAWGQKGVGDPVGVARQGIRPALVWLSGHVKSVETHSCEKTTGRAVIGTHLILEATDGGEYNVHLGAAEAVTETVGRLPVGTSVEVVAFRTETMHNGHYVAKELTAHGRTFQLRDATLRPFWAISPGHKQSLRDERAKFSYGRGCRALERQKPCVGRRRGRGRRCLGWGRGRRRGYGRGPCWAR
jgi:hypothetical protein